jgi:hypothetical protein
MTKEELVSILEKGVLAPSADNLQPWKFKIDTNYIELLLDSDRIKNFCDEGYSVPCISAGAVIENIRIAARALGYEIALRYFPNEKNPLLAAVITFTAGSSKNTRHLEVLDKRATNRKFYKIRKKISAAFYSRLSAIAEEENQARLIWIRTEHPAYQKLARLLSQADQLRFENKRLIKELTDCLRFNQSETNRTKDGLDLKTFEAGFGGNFLFRLISFFEKSRLLSRAGLNLPYLRILGLSFILGWHTQLQLRSSQALGLLVTGGHSAEDYLRGGEMMERLWHEATQLELSIQPLEALPIFIINYNLTGGPDFTPKQREVLERLKRDFYAAFGINDAHGLILLFRIGYAAPPSARSLRRPLESFLIHEPDKVR